MHARHKMFELDPAKLTAAATTTFDEHGPLMKDFHKQGGYKGVTLVGSSATGKARVISFWQSEHDMNAGKGIDKRASDELHRAGGGSGEVSDDEWDVVVEHR